MSFPWQCQQLCSFWLCSCNNFALLSYTRRSCSKYHQFFFLFSIIISIFLLYYSHLNILNFHFIPFQSIFSFSLCQQKKVVLLHVFRVFFFFFLVVMLIYSKFLSDHLNKYSWSHHWVFVVRFGAILSYFKHQILRCSLAKTIIAPHLSFAVTCVVRYYIVYNM